MKKIYTILLYITLSITLNSCAMIFNANPDRVHIKSKPNDAKIFIGDSLLGETPQYIYLNPKKDLQKVTIKKEGYKDKIIDIERSTQYNILALDILTIEPVLFSLVGGYHYRSFFPYSCNVILDNIDTVNITSSTPKVFKPDYGDNFIIAEAMPAYLAIAVYLSATANYYRDIYHFANTGKSQSSLGIKGGWGWATGGALDGGGLEGFGYNIMPCYSYEIYSDVSENSLKHIFAFGKSYFQTISIGDHTTYKKGFRYSFQYQYLITNLNSNLFYGFSVGHVNASNVAQISFGYRF
ncbi:MAG: PEGA domain-containing protein [Candidatus Kapabacteria bacterium]|nr:PEGA domain-containing protein [Candidatus Kapabacteria bacterium]